MGNPMQAIMQMLSNCGNNPQQMAQQILRQNPSFASMLQGQNTRQLAEGAMRQMGIDPSQIGKLMNGNSRPNIPSHR